MIETNIFLSLLRLLTSKHSQEVSSGRGFTAPGCQDCLGGEVVVVGMGGVLEVGLSRSDSTHSNAKPDRGLD